MATMKFKYLADILLNVEVGLNASPALPTTLYVALLTAMPTKNDATGLVEVSTVGTGYARLPITSAQWAAITTNADNITEQSLSSIGLTWTNSGATNFGNIVAIATNDALTAGNWYRATTLATGNQVINNPNVFNLPATNVVRGEN